MENIFSTMIMIIPTTLSFNQTPLKKKTVISHSTWHLQPDMFSTSTIIQIAKSSPCRKNFWTLLCNFSEVLDPIQDFQTCHDQGSRPSSSEQQVQATMDLPPVYVEQEQRPRATEATAKTTNTWYNPSSFGVALPDPYISPNIADWKKTKVNEIYIRRL